WRRGTGRSDRRRAVRGTSRGARPRLSVRPTSEDALRSAVGESVDGEGQLGHALGVEALEVLGQVEEPGLLGIADDALGQCLELLDVVRPGEGTGAEGVGIGDGDLVDQRRTVLELDLHAAAEGLLVRVDRVVAAGPLRVLG